MKTSLTCLLLLLTLIGCKNENRLIFEPVVYDESGCAECPEIKITIPRALNTSKIDKSINAALREEVVSLLTFDNNVEANDIETAIQSFEEEFSDLRQRYPEETTSWEAQILGEIAYEDEFLLTIRLNSYLFTGGAHGYSTVRFLNFNKKKGSELENWELFENSDQFKNFAETKFRIQEGIPEGTAINSTGFMFDTNEFYLPENIGFTEEGLQILFEEYEVASYADGPIILTLPFSEIRSYLALPVKS